MVGTGFDGRGSGILTSVIRGTKSDKTGNEIEGSRFFFHVSQHRPCSGCLATAGGGGVVVGCEKNWSSLRSPIFDE